MPSAEPFGRLSGAERLRWAAAALAAGGLAYAVYRGVPPLTRLVDDGVTLATADLVRAVCDAAGVMVPGPGTVLFVPARPFYVAVECTGLNAFVVEASVVLTAPVAARRRAVGLLIAGLAVFAVNFVRLLTLVAAGRTSHALSCFLDYRLWPVVYVAVMMYATWRWYRWARRGAAGPETA